jgi:hypothetical protein
MIYADTSFIGSLYVPDVNTDTALSYMEKEQPQLPFLFLHWPELAKTVFSYPDAESIWERFKSDLTAGTKFSEPEISARRIGERAAGLMGHYSERWPRLRSQEVMHVAAAVESRARCFLSFGLHSAQRALAQTQKLKLWPALTAEEREKFK